jgi:hypothetical protein
MKGRIVEICYLVKFCADEVSGLKENCFGRIYTIAEGGHAEVCVTAKLDAFKVSPRIEGREPKFSSAVKSTSSKARL